MRTPSIAFALLSAICLAGCVAGVPQTDLSGVQPSAEQSKVEEVLGDPVATHTVNDTTVHVYEYDLGLAAPGDRMNPMGEATLGVFLLLSIETMGRVDEQRGYIAIAYSKDGKVELSRRASSKEAAVREVETYMVNVEKARRGDAEAQHWFGNLQLPGSDEQWLWVCRSANQGYMNAQAQVGTWYWSGSMSTLDKRKAQFSRDKLKSYVWYSLAIRNGHESAVEWRDLVAEDLTPAEITEAERQVVVWRPDPASCETTLAAPAQ